MIAFPLLIIIAAAHITMILLIYHTNNISNHLAELMQTSAAYQIEAKQMQGNNTVMSETCNGYIQMPANPDGSASVGSLMAYAKALDSDYFFEKVLDRFRGYDVSPKVVSCIEAAVGQSKQMMIIQLHSIALMSSVYTLPPVAELASLPLPALTAEETAMSAEERVALARQLISKGDYSQLRYFVSQNLDECNRTLQSEFDSAYTETQSRVNMLRKVLWFTMFAIIAILSAAFILLYRYIVRPLRKYSDDISANRKIDMNGGVSEMRRLVDSFNGLLAARNKLETILRSEAENDALTGLPNRYCFERDLIRNDDRTGYSVAILQFDVNYLKKANDTKGHLAGDQLIRTAANCIKECFSNDNGNCYRIGGDEFSSILTDCSENEVKMRIDNFSRALKRENITVSVGYAYTDDYDGERIHALMSEADKKMYEQKRRIHEMNKDAYEDSRIAPETGNGDK